MKISEVIAELQKIQEEHGDLRVLANNECGTASTVCEGISIGTPYPTISTVKKWWRSTYEN